MVKGLTERQRLVLGAIQTFWNEHGIAPTLADLAVVLRVRRSAVHQHFLALKKKGYLDHIESSGRSWRPIGRLKQARRIPLIGRVAAGLPILAQENIDDWISVGDLNATDTFFALRVRGDSMTGAAILDGDIVVVRKQDIANDGDIVVALLDGEEATVKRLRHEEGAILLVAENPKYPAIVACSERLCIQGKVIAVWRSLEEQNQDETGEHL